MALHVVGLFAGGKFDEAEKIFDDGAVDSTSAYERSLLCANIADVLRFWLHKPYGMEWTAAKEIVRRDLVGLVKEAPTRFVINFDMHSPVIRSLEMCEALEAATNPTQRVFKMFLCDSEYHPPIVFEYMIKRFGFDYITMFADHARQHSDSLLSKMHYCVEWAKIVKEAVKKHGPIRDFALERMINFKIRYYFPSDVEIVRNMSPLDTSYRDAVCGDSLLHIAASDGSWGVAIELIQTHGHPVNVYNDVFLTPIYYLISPHHRGGDNHVLKTKLINLMISYGADLYGYPKMYQKRRKRFEYFLALNRIAKERLCDDLADRLKMYL
jgi:hypothetical protein